MFVYLTIVFVKLRFYGCFHPCFYLQASILSAVEEKVRRRIWEEFSTLKAEHLSLQKMNEDLNNGKIR